MRYVIFDLDGTLADSSPGIVASFRSTLAERNVTATDAQLHRLIGPPLRESFAHLGVSDDELDAVVERYRSFYATEGVFATSLYPGIRELLESLRAQSVAMAVATAKRVDFARQMLAHLGVDEYFDVIEGASMDLTRTAKRDIIRVVLAHWRIDASSDVTMVGDRAFDMRAARTVGLYAVGVLWGFGSAEELTEAGAHRLISSPAEFDESGGDAPCWAEQVCDECGRLGDHEHS